MIISLKKNGSLDQRTIEKALRGFLQIVKWNPPQTKNKTFFLISLVEFMIGFPWLVLDDSIVSCWFMIHPYCWSSLVHNVHASYALMSPSSFDLIGKENEYICGAKWHFNFEFCPSVFEKPIIMIVWHIDIICNLSVQGQSLNANIIC